MVLGWESAAALLREWSCELLVRVVVVVEAAEARKEEAGGSSETSAGRNWCWWRAREVTMEATVGKLPSTLELGPEVVALAQQRHTVGLQVVHTRGRSRLHLPRLVLG